MASLQPAVRIEFLADHPALIPAIGQLRYHAWGGSSQTGLAGWIAITARVAGPGGPPDYVGRSRGQWRGPRRGWAASRDRTSLGAQSSAPPSSG
jgi:hypothetical protein